MSRWLIAALWLTAAATAFPLPMAAAEGVAGGQGPTLTRASGPARSAATAVPDRSGWLVDIDDTGAADDPPLPPALDLRRLRMKVVDLSWGGKPPRPVLLAQIETTPGPEAYPLGTELRLELAWKRAGTRSRDTSPPSDLTLVFRMVPVPADRARRRGQPAAADGGRPAVARFAGSDDLGGLSSFIPGRSVTFRLPLTRLAATRPTTAPGTGEVWRLAVWVESTGPAGRDVLPAGPPSSPSTPPRPAPADLDIPRP
ncbi:MAG: hypothetical protein ACE5IK_04300 [Acidobacteriota bacterium]